MNSNIATVIANLRAARSEIKAIAATARASAPKGQKMVMGQHAQSEASKAIAGVAISDITAAGWVASSVTVNKAGTDIAVHFRAPVTLEQRVAKWTEATMNARARRDAKRAAKAAAVVPAPKSDMASLIAALKKVS